MAQSPAAINANAGEGKTGHTAESRNLCLVAHAPPMLRPNRFALACTPTTNQLQPQSLAKSLHRVTDSTNTRERGKPANVDGTRADGAWRPWPCLLPGAAEMQACFHALEHSLGANVHVPWSICPRAHHKTAKAQAGPPPAVLHLPVGKRCRIPLSFLRGTLCCSGSGLKDRS